MSATIKDVAERAGVSIATVSYVITGTKKVKDSTRDKVKQAIKELNYAPNLLAKGLKEKRGNLIGFITPNLNSPYLISLMKNCEKQLKDGGYQMLVLTYDQKNSTDTDAIRMLCNGIVSGLVWVASSETAKIISQIVPSNIPVIVIGTEEVFSLTDTVYTDTENKLTDLFQETNNKEHSLMIITNPNYMYNEDEQYRLIGVALDESGFPENKVVFLNAQSSEEKMPKIMQEKKPASVCAFGADAIWDVFQDKETRELCIPEFLDIYYMGGSQYDRFLTSKCKPLHEPVETMAEEIRNILVDDLKTNG